LSNNDKQDNNGYVVKITLITILSIIAVGGIIGSGIQLAAKGFDAMFLSILILSIVLIPILIYSGIKVTGNHTESMIEGIKNGNIRKITEWDFDQKEWAKFTKWKKQENFEKVKGTALSTFLISITCLIFVGFIAFNWLTLLIYSFLGALVFTGLFTTLIYFGGHFQLKKMSSYDTGKIIFTERAILINKFLISVNALGMELFGIQSCTKDNLKVLEVIIETGFGYHKNRHEFSFPIPDGKFKEAEMLIKLYRKLIKLKYNYSGS
jgi:hypothetical protein